MATDPEIVDIQFKGKKAHPDFERFVRDLIIQSGLGKAVFVYVDFQVPGTGSNAEKMILRGVVANRVAFKAQGRRNESCFRGAMFVSAGTASNAYDVLSRLDGVSVRDRDDLTDVAEDIRHIADTDGIEIREDYIFEMLGIQAIQNFVHGGKATEVSQLRGILRQLKVSGHIDNRVKKFCREYLVHHPSGKGYAPTLKLAVALRSANVFAKFRDADVVGIAIEEYGRVSTELEQIEDSSLEGVIETNESRIAQLRADAEEIENTNRLLKLQQSERDSRVVELEATKQILMELTLREGVPVLLA